MPAKKSGGRPSASNPKGSVRSGGELKFRTNTPGRARNAMARLNQAKPSLTPGQKRTVARAVETRIGSTPKTRRILGKAKK